MRSRDSVATQLAAGQVAQPLHRLLGRRREVEVRLVGTRRVVLAQPGVVLVRPVVEVLPGTARERLGPQPLAELVEVVLQRRGELGLWQSPDVRLDERPKHEAREERGVVGAEEPPARVRLAQEDQRLVAERIAPR